MVFSSLSFFILLPAACILRLFPNQQSEMA